MKMLDTSKGPMAANLLTEQRKEARCPSGVLVTTEYFYHGELVKCDQHLQVDETLMPGSSGAASL